MTSAKTGTTVVLVHAAWADGSSWNKVTGELQRKGFEAVAAQMPLTSFTDDVAVLKKVLFRQKGPIVLAGHITAARMKSKIVSLPVDHTTLVSRPDAVADLGTVAATTA